MNLLTSWFRRTFADPQVVILGIVLIVSVAIVAGLGRMLAPVFASIVIAYLLEAVVIRLQKLGLAQACIRVLVFLLFLASLFFLLFGLVPMLTRQLTQLVQQIPNYITQGQELLLQLPQRYPQLISEQQIQQLINSAGTELAVAGQQFLTWSLTSVGNVVGLLVLLGVDSGTGFFPAQGQETVDRLVQGLSSGRAPPGFIGLGRCRGTDCQLCSWQGWRDRYRRCRQLHHFHFIGSAVLGVAGDDGGFSVLIPYIGAAVITLPIAFVAYFQWGWGWSFGQVMIAYGIIQALDGNVLVPLLFSEALNLHPVAIIVAILVFGGLWGFWGVFFAIPLATVVQAVLRAWPRNTEEKTESDPPAEAEPDVN